MDVKIEGVDAVRKRLRELGIDTKRSQELILRAGAEVIKKRAADNVRSVSVDIAESIQVEEQGAKNDMAVVGVGPLKSRWYAQYVERGTKPHVVRAKAGKRLKFVGEDGTFIYPRQVQHPGIKPRPFMKPAADENDAEVLGAMADKAETIVLRVTVT